MSNTATSAEQRARWVLAVVSTAIVAGVAAVAVQERRRASQAIEMVRRQPVVMQAAKPFQPHPRPITMIVLACVLGLSLIVIIAGAFFAVMATVAGDIQPLKGSVIIAGLVMGLLVGVGLRMFLDEQIEWSIITVVRYATSPAYMRMLERRDQLTGHI